MSEQVKLTPAQVAARLKYCRGCENNFYNGNNPYDVKRCWSLNSSKIATRFRIPTHVMMDRAENFVKVKTLSCFHEKGYAYLNAMPAHLVQISSRRRSKEAANV